MRDIWTIWGAYELSTRQEHRGLMLHLSTRRHNQDGQIHSRKGICYGRYLVKHSAYAYAHGMKLENHGFMTICYHTVCMVADCMWYGMYVEYHIMTNMAGTTRVKMLKMRDIWRKPGPIEGNRNRDCICLWALKEARKSCIMVICSHTVAMNKKTLKLFSSYVSTA